MAEEATSLDAVIKLLGLFTGSGKTTETSSGGTTTKSSQVSPDGLAAILKSSLESNQGLAQLLGGQNASGLYNSSTNQLLSNDLVSRLTAQAAANSKTETITTPQTTQSRQTAGALSGQNGVNAAAGIAGGTLLKNLLGTGAKAALDPKARGQIGDLADKVGSIFSSTGAGADTAVALGSGLESFDTGTLSGFTNAAGLSNTGTDILNAAGSGDIVQNLLGSLAGNSDISLVSDVGNLFSSSSTTDAVISAAEEASNFQAATSATGSTIAGIASKAGSVSDSVDVASAISDGSDLQSLLDAQEGYANAEKFKSAYDAVDGTSAVTSADLGMTDSLLGEGSITGYLSSVLMAMNAPEAAHGKDYREAVGSAILNYFGFGWATPIVDAVARPVLDSAMDSGNKSLGNFGSVLADPIGAPLSGQYDVGDLITSTLDPANVLGGNEGGSTGQLVAAGLDPFGAMIGGGDGIFNGIADGVNSVESADPIGNAIGSLLGQGDDGGGLPGIGKVICTQLAYEGNLDMGLYKLAISPELAMKPQTLRGYHVIGSPVVRLLRKYPAFSEWLAPYTAHYINHKAGKKNWRGFLIKNILHPISWFLGFFNKNPDYYKQLYRRERNT